MTTTEFFAMLLRRWYVVVVGLGATLTVTVAVGHPAPVYWTSTTVVVVRPVTKSTPNALQNQDPMTPVASLVVLRFNGGLMKIKPSSKDAPLYGRGMRRAVQVQVRNLGSQWAPQIQDPNIDIQVVDGSPEAVHARLKETTDRLAAILAEVQAELGVADATRLSLANGPPAPVSQIPANPRRAQVVVLLLGGVLTSVVVRAFEALTGRRRSSRSPRSGSRSQDVHARAMLEETLC